jgi:hypothetical protein
MNEGATGYQYQTNVLKLEIIHDLRNQKERLNIGLIGLINLKGIDATPPSTPSPLTGAFGSKRR